MISSNEISASAERQSGDLPDHGSAVEWPSPTYAWYVVGVLLLCQILSFVDRQIVSLFLDPIRKSLHLSDTQVSLVTGLAFALFYATVGVPIARLADQSNRKRIIQIGVAFWSVMCALTGFAGGFWQLLVTRMGVGAGEATLSPSAFSLLSDYFPREKLSRAISVFSTGAYLGMALAMFAGGLVARLGTSAPLFGMPELGIFQTWQLALIYTALLGLPLWLLLFTVREPRRTGDDAAQARSDHNPSSLSALKAFVFSNGRTFAFLVPGFQLYCMANAAILLWIPTFFIRTYGMSAAQVGWSYGLVLLLFGPLGVYLSGYFSDRMIQAGKLDGPVRVATYGAAASIPFAIFTPLMPSPILALIGTCGLVLFIGGPCTLGFTAFPMMTPNRLRAQVTALYFLSVNLVTGLAPVIVAMATDYVIGDPLGLRYSLAVIPAFYLIIAVFALRGALEPYARTVGNLIARASPV